MSIWTAKSGLLSMKPQITAEAGRITLSTPLWRQALCLGFYGREAVLDKRSRRGSIVTRWLWFVRSRREFSLDRVEYIDTQFKSLTTAWSWYHGKTDQLEKFSIILVLKSPYERVTLCSFSGEGAVHTGMSGVLFSGDDLIDYAGTQEEDFRAFLRTLESFLEVPVGGPRVEVRAADGSKKTCLACGRTIPPALPRCQFCGGEAITTPAPEPPPQVQPPAPAPPPRRETSRGMSFED